MLAEKTPNVDKPHSVRLLKAGRTPLPPERAATHDTVERPTYQTRSSRILEDQVDFEF